MESTVSLTIGQFYPIAHKIAENYSAHNK